VVMAAGNTRVQRDRGHGFYFDGVVWSGGVGGGPEGIVAGGIRDLTYCADSRHG